MIKFPEIDPVIVSIGPINIYWYSFGYIFGILFGWFYAVKLAKKFKLNIPKKTIEDCISWVIIGIILGGRLGYVLFYDLDRYLAHPIAILKIYEGGMASHGGFIGVILATYLFCRKHKVEFMLMADIAAAVAAIGFFLGRIGNFINAELYGRITDVPWAMIFPNSDMMPRHPSQLYEAAGEGLLLFIVTNIAIYKYNSFNYSGRTSSIFLIYYSIFRAFAEIFREPDLQIGFIANHVTMGQILSLPLLITGIYLYLRSRSRCRSIPK